MGEATTLPVRIVEGPGGGRAPFYVIPFDKSGTCVAPVARDLLARAALDATDVFVFSHGWNADLDTAVSHYDAFIRTFIDLRRRAWPAPERDYRPLLAGVFWPSSALSTPTMGDDGTEHDRAMLAELATGLTRDERGTARELAARPFLDPVAAQRLAGLLSILVRSEDDEPHEGPDVRPDPLALVDAARAEGDDGVDPRALVRLATMLLMKERAATVGVHGVTELLLRLQATPAPDRRERRRLHLVGHSYGAKVMLAALSSPQAGALLVDSVLLLQPAVSAWCFAPEGPAGADESGTYRPALRRTRQPLVTTFSPHDVPLNQVYVNPERTVDAAGPSPYAALGGRGPAGVDHAVVRAAEPPDRYDFPPDAPNHLIGIDAAGVISGHDDVASEATAWMLLNQVRP